MWLVKGGAHCQLFDRYPEEYEERVEELIQVRGGKGSFKVLIISEFLLFVLVG